MKERRMARRCRNCGESMPNDALLCAACGSATSEICTRLTDRTNCARRAFSLEKRNVVLEVSGYPCHSTAPRRE